MSMPEAQAFEFRPYAPRTIAWDVHVYPPPLKGGVSPLPSNLYVSLPHPIAELYIGTQLTKNTMHEILQAVSEIPPCVKGLLITEQVMNEGSWTNFQSPIVTDQLLDFLKAFPALWATWIVNRQFKVSNSDTVIKTIVPGSATTLEKRRSDLLHTFLGYNSASRLGIQIDAFSFNASYIIKSNPRLRVLELYPPNNKNFKDEFHRSSIAQLLVDTLNSIPGTNTIEEVILPLDLGRTISTLLRILETPGKFERLRRVEILPATMLLQYHDPMRDGVEFTSVTKAISQWMTDTATRRNEDFLFKLLLPSSINVDALRWPQIRFSTMW